MLIKHTSRREDPALAHNFVIALLDSSSDLLTSCKPQGGWPSLDVSAINDSKVGGFSECSGLEMTLDIHEHEEGGRNGNVLKFPTRTKWTNLTLKRGVGLGSELWEWYYGFVEGRGVRRDGLIALQDDRQFPHTIWSFFRGLPAKYTGPSMNAGKSDVAIETLEIAHEGLALVENDAIGMVEVGELVTKVF